MKMLITSAIFAVFLLISTFGSATAFAVSQTTCNTILPSNIVIPAVSAGTAYALAQASPQFMAAVAGQSYRFSGAAEEGHCGQLESIDINFIVTNSSSGSQEDLIVPFGISSDYTPTTTIVRAMSVMPVMSFGSPNSSSILQPLTTGGGGVYQSTIWSGYQFCNGHNSGGAYCANTPNTLQGVAGTWIQPHHYVPPSGPTCTGGSNCNVSPWVGLDDASPPGNNQILQAGSTTLVYGCPLCIGKDALWWEALVTAPGTANFCGGSVGAGDTITASVVFVSGTSYDVQSGDTTSGATCYSSPYPYSPWSYSTTWGDFIVERAPIQACSFCGTYSDLAKFNNFYLQGKIEWSGAWNPIDRYYGNVWYNMVYMYNSGTYNVCSGSWTAPSSCTASVISGSTGYGEFYNTWISSVNT